MVDFHKFFDGENITQKDLVAWINVGTHHLVSHKDNLRHGFDASNTPNLSTSPKLKTPPIRARIQLPPGTLTLP